MKIKAKDKKSFEMVIGFISAMQNYYRNQYVKIFGRLYWKRGDIK